MNRKDQRMMDDMPNISIEIGQMGAVVNLQKASSKQATVANKS